ncbi:hypothetical protein B9479_005975 [Cryptococcus floricola]|uniref:Uncharacterized protein n=1 Tax=Cryptococcus floricola TaxID=2591691 RepID=A0A5D3APK0_9TREE|nr:hypothetical protein B9479_005975 [Cryptococcus floricola]
MLPLPHPVLPQTQEAMLHSAYACPAHDPERTPRYGRGSDTAGSRASSPEHKETTPTKLPLCDTASTSPVSSTSPPAGLALKKRPTTKAKDGEAPRSTRRRGECKDKRTMERSRPAPAWLTGSAPAIHPPPPTTHFFPQLISQVRTVPVTRPDSTPPASSSTLNQRRASVPSVDTGRVAEDEQPIDILRLAAYLSGKQSSAPGPLENVGGLYVDPIYTAVSPSPSPSPDAYPSSTPPASSTDCSAPTCYLSSSTAPTWASSPVHRRASEPNTTSPYTPLHGPTPPPSTINTVSTSHTTTFTTPRQVSSCTAPWASVPIPPSSAASASAAAMFGSWQGWQGQGQGQGQGHGGWTLPTVTESRLLDGDAPALKWRTSPVSVDCHPYILPSPMDMGWTPSTSSSSTSSSSGCDSQRNSISSTAGPSTPGSSSPYLYPSFYDFTSVPSGASGASGPSDNSAAPAPAPIPAVEPTYPSQASYLPAPPPSYSPEPPMGTYMAPSHSHSHSDFSSDHAFSSYHWPATTPTAPTSTSTSAPPLAPPTHLPPPPPHVAPPTTTTAAAVQVRDYPNYPSAPLSPPAERQGGVYKLPLFPAPPPPFPPLPPPGDGSAPGAAWALESMSGMDGMEGLSGMGMDGMGHSSAPGGKVYNYQDPFPVRDYARDYERE